MQNSSKIILALTILTAIGLFYLPAPARPSDQEFKYFKNEFQSFKTKFNRQYYLMEEKFRFQIFMENLKFINQHNLDSSKTYKMGVTNFADMTEQ